MISERGEISTSALKKYSEGTCVDISSPLKDWLLAAVVHLFLISRAAFSSGFSP